MSRRPSRAGCTASRCERILRADVAAPSDAQIFSARATSLKLGSGLADLVELVSELTRER